MADSTGDLPPVVVTDVVCGCGVGPDGVPYAWGCSAECGAPAVATVGAQLTVHAQDRAITDGSGETWTVEAAEQRALELFAAARWLRLLDNPGQVGHG